SAMEMTASELRLLGSLGSWRKLVNVDVFGSKRSRPFPSVPSQIKPFRSSKIVEIWLKLRELGASKLCSNDLNFCRCGLIRNTPWCPAENQSDPSPSSIICVIAAGGKRNLS